MAYQQRGNYGNQRGNSRGNGNGGGNNRGGGQNRAPNVYLRSSTFIRKLKFENKAEFDAYIDDTIAALNDLQFDPKGVEFPLAPMGSEELAFTYTGQKVEDLQGMIQDAVNDPQGDGGIRITTYLQHKTNQDTGEEFDGASTMIVGKFPPRNQQKGGGGSFKGKGNTGRRDYTSGNNRTETKTEDPKQEGKSTKSRQTRTSQQTTSPSDEKDYGHEGTTSDQGYEDTRW